MIIKIHVWSRIMLMCLDVHVFEEMTKKHLLGTDKLPEK